MSMSVDDSELPVVIFSFIGAVSEEDFANYLGEMSHALNRGQQFVSIVNVSRATWSPGAMKMMRRQWLAQHEAIVSSCLLGTALVMPSATTGSMLGAVVGMQSGSIICPTLPAAIFWANWVLKQTRLRRAG